MHRYPMTIAALTLTAILLSPSGARTTRAQIMAADAFPPDAQGTTPPANVE